MHITPFYPKDALSAELLRSIPKKVEAMLLNMGQETDRAGGYGNLKWNFDPLTGGTLIYGSDANDNFIQIWWRDETICAGDRRVEHLSHDLEFFVALEQNIYGELEKLQQELDSSHKINPQQVAIDLVIDRQSKEP